MKNIQYNLSEKIFQQSSYKMSGNNTIRAGKGKKLKKKIETFHKKKSAKEKGRKCKT